MTSGFVTWCERGMRQKLAATVEPVWDGVSRQISLLPRGVSGGLQPGTWGPGMWSCILVVGALLSLSKAPPALPRSPPLLTTLYTDVRGHRTYGEQLTEKRRQRSQPRGRLCVPSSSAASWLPVCWDDGWSMRTSVLPSGILFLLKAFEKILFFSKPFYQSSLMSALSSKPIVVETSAPLSWISNLPKSGMFSPGK